MLCLPGTAAAAVDAPPKPSFFGQRRKAMSVCLRGIKNSYVLYTYISYRSRSITHDVHDYSVADKKVNLDAVYMILLYIQES